MLIDGKKVACATCIKGHRATHCKHKDRPMVEIKKKGRPATQCPRCRELRVVRQLHVKCSCYDEKELKRARSMNDQDSKMIKKLVIDISKANLRLIAPRPKQIPDSPLEQKQQLVDDHPIFSRYPLPPRTSSSSSRPPPPPPLPLPSISNSLSVVSPHDPFASSPPLQNDFATQSFIPSSPLQNDFGTQTFSPSPTITKSTSCCSSSSTQVTLQPVSKCRCQPGSSCGCKKEGNGNGSCCGSSTKPPTKPSSCCGSSIPPPPPPPLPIEPASCCGSSTLPSTESNSCCGSSTLSSTESTSCCRSSPSSSVSSSSSSSLSSSSLSSIAASHNFETPKSCCSSPIESTATSTTPPPIPAPAPATTKPKSKPTMCEDGYGKSSCCSSKQRNAMGETIRLVTCRCGDSCACIGCDAHPSRAMKSSQQDPYAGYTDILSLGRRRLSIAAICTPSTTKPRPDKIDDMPTSVLAENGTLLCGCGCSNALNECTSCFQELCQDYYAGQ